MSNALATTGNGEIMERVLMVGDLSKLQPQERVNYYNAVCSSIGLNPLTRPFDYINLNGKLVLYTKKDATEQLRNLHGVSITSCDVNFSDDLIVVTVTAQNASGRADTDLGVVTLGNLKGDAKANAVMKAITKAKRRVTLSLCGLGWLDETEIETIPPTAVRSITVTEDGEIVEGEVTDTRAETSPQAQATRERPKPPTNGKASDLTPPMPTGYMTRQFHALGTSLFGDEWDDKRPEMVKEISGKRESGEVVTSSNKLFRAEMQHLIDQMKDELETA